MTATGHSGPRDGQTNTSTLVETGSSSKTATGPAETVCGQEGSVTNPSESAFVHETANGPWSESATCETGHVTPQTANGHNDAFHDNLDLAREKTMKSVSGSGPQQTPRCVIDKHALQRQKRLPRKGQRAQVTPESERTLLLQPQEGKKQPSHSRPQKTRPPPPPPTHPHFPTERREGGRDLARAHVGDTLRRPRTATPL